MEIKPIKFTRTRATPAEESASGLAPHFAALAAEVNARYRSVYGGASGGADAVALLGVIAEFIALMDDLDGEFGSDGVLPVEGLDEAADQVLRCLADLDAWLDRLDLAALRAALQAVVLGVSLWTMRHECAIRAVEPVVNALAARANGASSRQETAAVFGMMQGMIEFLRPGLAADLERSDPQRPWRLLNLNFAIAGIRCGDEVLMRHAFETLDRNLPYDCPGFYGEALELAESAGLPAPIQEAIRAQTRKWTKVH